jgi:uncharacterized membrane protein
MEMIWLHVTAGAIALAAGAVALSAAKGGALHRASGMTFAVAMGVMTSSAILIALLLRPNAGNLVAGSMTLYLVLTGVLAVKVDVEPARALLAGLMLAAFAVGIAAIALARGIAGLPGGRMDGFTPAPLYFFAAIALLAGSLDLRMLLARELRGHHRLLRHLWRMGFALWIATSSFFIGQARQFPDGIRATGVLSVPVLLVAIALVYWIVRVQRRRGLVRRGDAATPHAAVAASPRC